MQTSIYPTERQSIVNGVDFEHQVALLRKRIYNLAYRILRSRDDAEDITQDTFVRAWKNIGNYEPERSFEAWVTRIARNLCLDTARRRNRLPTESLDAPRSRAIHGEPEGYQVADTTQDPATRLMQGAVDESLRRAVRALPVHYRGCVELMEKQHSYSEIGALMGCPVGTIRSRLYRARVLVRKELETNRTLFEGEAT